MQNRSENNKARKLRQLLVGTCLATGLVAMPAAAQDIDEIGTDLGNGADVGVVNGGTVDVSGAADVRGVGVSAGRGNDDVENIGDIDVDVQASEFVIFSGLSPRQNGAAVVAEGIGFFGDNGDDILINSGDIDVQSVGIGGIANLGLNLLGFFNVNAPSTVDVFSYGINGGLGDDVIENRGTVFANSISGISMIGQAPSSYEQNAVVSITSNATTIGIRGAHTDQQVINSGVLALSANALAASATLDAEIVNGVVVDSSTNANATIIGVEGGQGDDWITNSGTIGGVSVATAMRGSFAVSLSDGGIADNSINAIALNTGLWGGANDDMLFNSGDILISSGAHVESDSFEINLIDIAGGTFNSTPEATSIGMDGGSHDDYLENSGLISSSAMTESLANSVNLSLVDATIIGGRISAGYDTGESVAGAPPIQARAIGLSGGDGDDALVNTLGGEITLDGNANAESVSISVAAVGVPDAAFQAIVLGESLASLDTFASSEAIGMTGGADDDMLSNYGDITGGTISTAQQVGVAVSVPVGFLPSQAGFLPGFTLGGAGAGAWSNAIGMSGDEGDDTLFNNGIINLTSTADALAVAVSVELPDFSSSMGAAFDLSLTLADVVTDADAFATGMAGGDGNDNITNAAGGEITVVADADAASTGVGVTASFENEGVISEGVVVRASTEADADATAIDGGNGDDQIINDGIAAAVADATATTVGVTISLEGIAGGGAAGIAVADGSATSNATAQAITGGDGADLLLNNGALSADATANASATGVSVALTGAQMGGFAGAGTLSNTSATATADASGVDWSSSDKGAENHGSIDTNATATALGDSISIAASGTLVGLTIDASLADSSTTANATASAFDAPTGDHTITNFETLGAVSIATADSDSVAVDLGVVVQGGLAAGVSLTRAVTHSTATSTGVIGDLGVDTIVNLGTINADATADANSTSVAIGVNGTMAGVALNAAAADASSTATANATGISTGAFDDLAFTNDTLTSNANADANADSVAVDLAVVVGGGVAASGALTRGGVTSTANAMGVAMGDGADQLGAAGVVDVIATSMADADAVSIAMQGTATGLTLGAAIVEAATSANADASALNAGDGDDVVDNASTLTAKSTANADSTSVGIEIGATGAGISGGLSLANVATDATAVTGAIEGGLGADMITNSSALDVDAEADASGASVSVSLVGTLAGVSLGAALTDATVDANAYATGVAGDEAAGRVEKMGIAKTGAQNADTIVNTGIITVDSIAGSSGSAVSIAATLAPIPIGFALATAENTATGYAYGIDAGYGDDFVFNMADINVTSDVDVSGASVAAAVTFAALGGFDGVAHSNAYGMTGGWGDDYLFNDAIITSTAFADTGGVTVALNLLGGSIGDLDTRADANAYGIFGDAGADMLINASDIFANAEARAASTSVNLSVVGFTVADVSTKAFANATGVGGGDDDDIIENTGMIDVDALAETPSVSVSLTGVGAIFNDATTRSVAKARGLSGGAGADAIVTDSLITTTATANTTGVGVSVGLVSGGTANTSTAAEAESVGVSGGDDNDEIVNFGTLVSTATSTAASTSVNANIVGAAFADAGATSTSNAIGISGDAGDDAILNAGNIVSTSTAANAAGAISVSLGGLADTNILTTATANASGIDGGDGNDVIGHDGSITTTTTASANAQSVTVGAIGAGLADIRLTAETNGFGINAGAGDDQIITYLGSTTDVDSSISGNVNNTSVQLIGATSNKNVFSFTPTATGFDGGDGADFFGLYGTADIDASSTFTLKNTAITLIGAAFDNSAVTSTPSAIGLTAGAGDDVVYVADLLDARAVNTFSLSGYTFNLAGYAASKPMIGGAASAIGLDAGADNDIVLIDGTLIANASSTNTLSGVQTTILGANQSNAQAGAVGNAAGLIGGDGADVLLTNGVTDVDASATTNLSAVNFTLIGASNASGVITANSTGVGHDAGAGDDLAGNSGALFVDSVANLKTSGSVKVGIGGASSGSSTTSTAASSGMLGGAGNDLLFNTGSIRARSTATGTISRTGYAFIGGSNTTATGNATAISLGIGGGAGDDEIENTGSIEVRATSSTNASGNTTTTIGGAKASSTVSATARGVGIAGDSGDDFIKNFGTVTVSASARPDSTNSATTAGLFTDGVTNSRTTTSTRVIGIDGGAGENEIWNRGALTVETLGLARTESRSTGRTVGIDVDAQATATSSNNGQDARGVSAGNEATTLYNDGTINVAIRGAGYAFSDANGGSIIDGDGTARATVGVSNANAYGFIAGNGGNTLVNTGDIIILARPTGNADARSDADGIISTTQPDSRSTASVALNRVRAAGVWFGDGDDTVVNEGLIDVTSAPQANQAESDAKFGGDILGIDSFATSTATTNDASAYGVRAGNGENIIYNTGSIIARATPKAVANADARGVGFDGDAEARATANAKNAVAIGIETGSGNDLIWNEGAITAISNPSVTATTNADGGTACLIDIGGVRVCNDGEEVEDPKTSISGRRAVAVATNGGDDVLVNAGAITASIGSSVGNGVAISLGNGNDTLALLDGSSVLGSISLGAGNDTLLLRGVATTNGVPNGNSGSDTVLFEGAGAFTSGFTSFENARKTYTGTFVVPVLPSMTTLEIQGGVLQSTAGYSFNAGGAYTTFVDGSGAHGRLASAGNVSIAGAVNVSANLSLFSDGQIFDIVTGAAVGGAFSSESLPAATPLLSFDLVQSANAVQITSSVNSFASVASSNSTDQLFAAQLDDAALVAGGALEMHLAQLQQLPEGADFEVQIAQINPTRFDDYASDAADTIQQFESGVRQRLSMLRQLNTQSVSAGGFVEGVQPLSFSQSTQSDAGDGVAYGRWTAEFNADGNAFAEHQGSVSGFDYLMPSGDVFGASLGVTRSYSLLPSLADPESSIDNFMISFYGSRRISENQYLDAAISYGRQNYDSTLQQYGGDLASFGLQSEHGGRSVSASLESGRSFAFAGGRSEIFAGVRYESISEGQYDASSLDSVDVNVDRQDSHGLESEAGVRFGRRFDTLAGAFMPRISLSWNQRMHLGGDRIIAVFADAPGFEFRLPSHLRNASELRLGAGFDLWQYKYITVSSRFEVDLLNTEESVDSLLELKLRW